MSAIGNDLKASSELERTKLAKVLGGLSKGNVRHLANFLFNYITYEQEEHGNPLEETMLEEAIESYASQNTQGDSCADTI